MISLNALDELFPPLPNASEEDDGSLDYISNSINNNSIHQQISSSIDLALSEWNTISPVDSPLLDPNEEKEQLRDIFYDGNSNLRGIFDSIKTYNTFNLRLPTNISTLVDNSRKVFSTKQLEETPHWISKSTTDSSDWVLEFSDLKTRGSYKVLLSSTLTVLADMINDSCVYGKHVEPFDCKGYCFFIENEFYKNEEDITYEIREWIKKEDTSMYGAQHDHEPKLVDSTTFKDVGFLRFNAKYLYIHQGRCEHVLTLQNVVRTKAAFVGKKTMSDVIKRRKKCGVCQSYLAAYICDNDYHIGPKLRNYYCEKCYYSAHYHKQDGSLITSMADFKCYPYFHIP